MNCLIKLIQKECFCEEVGKRCHEAFPKLYLGKQVRTHHGLGHDVVMTLTEPIYHSCRHVYFDNFFTGLPLLISLLDVSHYGCGTVRINTSIFSEKISPANDGLFVLDGLFVHEGLYVYVQLTYKKAWLF